MWSNCSEYIEDYAVCDDTGESKGQCANCGYKWYEHLNYALPESILKDFKTLQEIREFQNLK